MTKIYCALWGRLLTALHSCHGGGGCTSGWRTKAKAPQDRDLEGLGTLRGCRAADVGYLKRPRGQYRNCGSDSKEPPEAQWILSVLPSGYVNPQLVPTWTTVPNEDPPSDLRAPGFAPPARGWGRGRLSGSGSEAPASGGLWEPCARLISTQAVGRAAPRRRMVLLVLLLLTCPWQIFCLFC